MTATGNPPYSDRWNRIPRIAAAVAESAIHNSVTSWRMYSTGYAQSHAVHPVNGDTRIRNRTIDHAGLQQDAIETLGEGPKPIRG